MGFDTGISRKNFLIGILSSAPFLVLAQTAQKRAVSLEEIRAAESLAGLSLSDTQRKTLQKSLAESRESLDQLRAKGIPFETGPAFVFVPQGKKPAPGRKVDVLTGKVTVIKPEKEEDIAFLTVVELGQLIKSKQLSPVTLTEIYLNRLQKLSPKLQNVITITTDLARQQAVQAEAEIAKGKYRGPLHGIPYGLKDLFATKDYPTTWGAEPYKNQVLTYNSAVVEKLTEAGAILVAKTAVGALAMDDKWFGGRSLNPWNTKQGSSGSSAGSSSGMAAGLFAFAIGTETLGSIISPAQRCRVTGLRPTFGRVSRFGAMPLSWTMDKVGPICRTAEDCAVVLSIIAGSDSRDPMAVDYPVKYRPTMPLNKLKIGVVTTKGFDEDDVAKEIGSVADILRSMGATLTPTKFTDSINGVDELLSIEAAAAFDEITRNNQVDSIENSLWPSIFRTAALLSGVDYIQAMRARTLVMQKFEEEFADFDLIIAPERAGNLLITTNLTGHPQIFVPMGANSAGKPVGISIIGQLYDEEKILTLANMIQRSTNTFRLRPDLSGL
jgi:Asp-tRNA(Asn)/Glu-tRNA(Gln) amidotransferase A subunit family amidase